MVNAETIIRIWARKYASCRVSADDLEQEGRIAAWQASQRYDRARGASLNTFLFRQIRGAMLHYLRDKASLIRIPAHLQKEILPMLCTSLSDENNENEAQFATRDFAPMLIESIAAKQEADLTHAPVKFVRVVRKPAKPVRIVRNSGEPTPRQMDVLRLMTTEALNIPQSAERLGITRATANKHISDIRKLWGVNSIMQCYNEAMRRGLIEPPTKI